MAILRGSTEAHEFFSISLEPADYAPLRGADPRYTSITTFPTAVPDSTN